MRNFEEKDFNAAKAKQIGFEAFKKNVNECIARGTIGTKNEKPTEAQIKAMFTKLTGIEVKTLTSNNNDK